MKKLLLSFLIALSSLCLPAQTRFYLGIGIPAPLSPAFNSNWNVTTGAARFVMNTTRDISTIASKTSAQVGGVAVRKTLIDQWISPELATQTVTGNFTGQVRMNLNSTTSTTGQGFLYLRVINRDGSIATEVGTCTTTDLTTTLTNRTLISLSVGTLSIQAGQRFCIDLGWNMSVGTTTTRTGTASRGSSSTTDLPANNTTTTANSPWVEFSQTLSLYTPTRGSLFSLMYKGVGISKSFAVFSPVDKNAGITLSGGNLVVTRAATGAAVRTTFGVSRGKWYWEATNTSSTGAFDTWMGIATVNEALTIAPGQAAADGNAWAMAMDGGDYYHNGFIAVSGAGTFPSVATNVFGFELDMDAGTFTIYQNNVALTPNPLFTGITGTVYPIIYVQTQTTVTTFNFGATAFTYTGHTGFNQGFWK